MPKIWKNEPFVTDPARAYTLDASWYLDPAVYELEQERIFARTWQPVAKLHNLTHIGDYIATDVVGEPIVVVHDANNRIRAYYNVCPHRAGAVARGQGNRKSLQCAYHGWTFDLNGCLMNTPYFFEVENFNPDEFNLHEIRTDVWGPYVFVNLDNDAPPLKDWWGNEFDNRRGLNFGEWKLVDEREYLIHVNWKVYLDNYAEGYHVATAHPGLAREMSLDDLYVDTYRFHSTQRAEIKPPYVGNPYKRRYVNPQPGDQIRYHVMFPNFMIDDYPDNLSTNVVKPLAHDKMLLKFDWWFKQEDTNQTVMESMIEFADQVQQEDIAICNDVQRNLRSRAYHAGRYSGRYENGVHHFHALVHAFLNSQTLPGFATQNQLVAS
jgi:choline monooxygenase